MTWTTMTSPQMIVIFPPLGLARLQGEPPPESRCAMEAWLDKIYWMPIDRLSHWEWCSQYQSFC